MISSGLSAHLQTFSTGFNAGLQMIRFGFNDRLQKVISGFNDRLATIISGCYFFDGIDDATDNGDDDFVGNTLFVGDHAKALVSSIRLVNRDIIFEADNIGSLLNIVFELVSVFASAGVDAGESPLVF
jgi:hypothetical protein